MPTARIAAPIIATAGLVLLLAACGDSPSSVGSGGSSSVGGSGNSHQVAFSRCMRSNGVTNFPDPDTSGVIPKESSQQLGVTLSTFQSAQNACTHLLPNGGQGPNQAQLQQVRAQGLRFAQCMRTHGVSKWPDPTLDQGRAVFDPQTAGIDTTSPQISAKVHECEHVFPASIGIPPGA